MQACIRSRPLHAPSSALAWIGDSCGAACESFVVQASIDMYTSIPRISIWTQSITIALSLPSKTTPTRPVRPCGVVALAACPPAPRAWGPGRVRSHRAHPPPPVCRVSGSEMEKYVNEHLSEVTYDVVTRVSSRLRSNNTRSYSLTLDVGITAPKPPAAPDREHTAKLDTVRVFCSCTMSVSFYLAVTSLLCL